MPSQAQQVRSVRVINGVFLASVVLYAYVGESLHPHGKEPDAILVVGISLVAAFAVGFGLFFRLTFLARALPALRADPENQVALDRWRAGQIISLVCCETPALFGLALRLVGAALPVVVPFYVAAAGLLLWLRPSEPLR